MNFGFLLFHDLEELDLVGPWEMVSMWSKYADGPKNRLMIAEKDKPVTCYNGMIIHPHALFQNAPQLDYLLVPGGNGRVAAEKNQMLTDFVARQAEHCKVVLSVCSGTFILHSAGLLSGKKVTSHYTVLDELRDRGDVEVVEARFVKDGKIWTSAGVSAGIDMALELIAQEAGEETASKVQLLAEYYPAGKIYGTAHRDPKAPGYLKMKNS